MQFLESSIIGLRSAVHRYAVSPDPAEELSQVGYLGLMKAITHCSYQLHTNAYLIKPAGFDHFIDAIRKVDEFFLALIQRPA